MKTQLFPWHARLSDLLEDASFGLRREALEAPLDISESAGDYLVQLDAPGLQADGFEVEFKEGQLWISGERTPPAEKDRKHHRRERRFGKFRRSIALPEEIDASRISARYKDGVLQVTVPKAEAARPKRIEVQAG